MSMTLDEDLLKVFIAESGENLDGFEDALMRLEEGDMEASMVQEAFRLIHNIKGSAAMVGLQRLSELAHALEDRLDLIRKGREMLEPDLLNLLFQGADLLREMIGAPRENDSPTMREKVLAFISRLRGEMTRSKPEEAKPAEEPAVSDSSRAIHWESHDLLHVRVEIKPDVVFKDVKACLIKTNLQELGTILRIMPPINTEDAAENRSYDFLLTTAAEPDTVRKKVESVAEIEQVVVEPVSTGNLATVKAIFGECPGAEETAGVRVSRRCPARTFSVIVCRISESANVVRLIGELDGEGVVALMDLFRENPGLIISNITLDLSKLYYINNLGLGFLLCLYRNVKERGGRIMAIAPPADVKKVLDLTKISNLIPVFDSIDEACAAKDRG